MTTALLPMTSVHRLVFHDENSVTTLHHMLTRIETAGGIGGCRGCGRGRPSLRKLVLGPEGAGVISVTKPANRCRRSCWINAGG